MEIGRHWKAIQAIFDEGGRSCRHFAVATVSKEGFPNVTPIGALFLRDDKTGFCFDEFTVNMSKNADENQKVTILAVNSDPEFWEKSLIKGKFLTAPGVRLMGVMGKKRKALSREIDLWKSHIKPVEGTKGYELLWKNLETVRDITFDSFEPVSCGEMTQGLWS